MRTPFLLLFLFLIKLAQASSGDRDPAFQACVSKKLAEPCSLSLSLLLTRWTCEDDAKYQCTHILTDKAERTGAPIEQFYGKWAFKRFAGIQEPASVLFSLLNMVAHIRGGKKLQQKISKEHPMRPYYVTFTWFNINLWVWSSVFHTRDKTWTERADYFSAGLAMIYGLYYTIVRLYHLYTKPRLLIYGSSSRHRFLAPWGAFCSLLYVAHVFYLSILPRFDYGWNMKVNLVVGLMYNLLWMAYALPNPPFQRFRSVPNKPAPSYASKPAKVAVAMICAVSLEIFDFPPWWRIIDAHSLWHLATIPIIQQWYLFLIEDSLDPAWKSRGLS